MLDDPVKGWSRRPREAPFSSTRSTRLQQRHRRPFCECFRNAYSGGSDRITRSKSTSDLSQRQTFHLGSLWRVAGSAQISTTDCVSSPSTSHHYERGETI